VEVEEEVEEEVEDVVIHSFFTLPVIAIQIVFSV
jgi:hypothetical protein